MSLRELWREFAAARQRWHDDYQQTLILAWHVAAFQRQKKIPGLKDLLKRAETSAAPQKPPTMAQQKAQLVMLSEYLGRSLRSGKARKQKNKQAHG